MQIYSILENNIHLEMAIATMEKRGVKKEAIYAVPLDNRMEDRRLFDGIHTSDGTSLIDIGVALATAFSVIGTSIGFVLSWGLFIGGLLPHLLVLLLELQLGSF